ncbi:DNA/RNA helicase domain-containing protein [Streptococcus uberis]|uniref:DNA/RNA helicase domain-containing protein n=1 Tax=Streptococcus uberis TaxID=1349 RepID=UPI0037A66D40
MKKGFHNLLTYLSAFENSDIFKDYKKINNIADLQPHELNDIKIISEKIRSISEESGQLYGYIFDKLVEITIREQFDILRYSENSILNIELKSLPKSDDEIFDQLVRHHYLLKCIPGNRDIHLFTYVSSSDTLYKFVDEGDGHIETTTFRELVSNIPIDFIEDDLLACLKPENFVISPYSDLEKFLNFKYFLNTEQRKFVDDQISDVSSTLHSMLKGGAGTGKSLVLFDLAKKYSALGKKVLFIFCSRLPNYYEINEHFEFTFTDITHSNIMNVKPGDYDLIIIDESQRLLEKQLSALFTLNTKLIFAVDKAQTLKPTEDDLDLEGKLEESFSENKIYDLSTKVRTDVSLSTFIQKFFDKSSTGIQPMEFPKVNCVYFSNKSEAIDFLQNLMTTEGYVSIEVAQFTSFINGEIHNKKIFSESLDGFTVIGREFDNVVIPIDSRVKYHNNKLYFVTKGYFPYKATNGLFQSITRVKNNLLFVVVDNPKMFNEIQKIINWSKNKITEQISKRLVRLREISNSDISDISKNCKISEETYELIEMTGSFPSLKILNRLANFYNISSDFLLGEPTQLSYTDFDIIYQLITKSLTKREKSDLNDRLIEFLRSTDKNLQ